MNSSLVLTGAGSRVWGSRSVVGCVGPLGVPWGLGFWPAQVALLHFALDVCHELLRWPARFGRKADGRDLGESFGCQMLRASTSVLSWLKYALGSSLLVWIVLSQSYLPSQEGNDNYSSSDSDKAGN